MDVKDALKKYEAAITYWSDIYEAAKEDIRFSIGLDHWTNREINTRGQSNCMIMPILPQFIHQVMNDMRQNTPSINVLPGESDGADPETAKIFKGLIRNIEYKSNADEVYDTGSEYSVRGGLGFARVDHDYISDDSLLQELKLKRVHNPLSVYLDPAYREADGSDAEWGFILEEISKEDFERLYRDKNFISFDSSPTHAKAEVIQIAEFFIKEYKSNKIELDGKERTIRKVKIGRYKLSGDEVLESTTFPGKYIPIVPFQGEEVWDDGKRNLLSLGRQAKDAQRRVNKWACKESDILDMAPIAPVQAPVGAVDDFMAEWGSPGEVNVMRYRMFDAAGNKLDKPERLQPPPVPTGIINAMEGAKQAVKEALGMYNASIGQKSNAISGVAYDSQKLEADVATFHFPDNRNRAIQHLGRILVCAIPEVYDTPRVIQIIGGEEEPQMVGINGAPKQHGQEYDHDLTKGQYDVRVTTGPSYTTKRQETAALMGDVMNKNPALMGVIGDLYFKNLDVAGADAIAERIRKTIPKELIADEEAKRTGEQPIDPEKIQMTQLLEQMNAQIQQMSAELQNKQGDQIIKEQEIAIKNKEIDIKAAEVRLKYLQAAQVSAVDNAPNPEQSEGAAMQTNESVESLQLRIEQETQRLIQMKDEADRQSQEKAMMDEQAAFVEADKRQREDAESMVRNEQANAVINMLGVVAEKLSQLTVQVARPKDVIRDPVTGLIRGVQ